jgi:SAM-dependent methyltransferase
MHQSVMAWAEEVITAGDVTDKTVVEAGSQDVNGTVRDLIMAMHPGLYVGIDAEMAPGVDVVCDVADMPALGLSPDLVVSTEMLEHVPDWQGAVRGMVLALKPGGVLAVTTRSRGFPYHGYPGDFWRYSLTQMRLIIEGAGLGILDLRADPQVPGVFCKARKPADWAEPDWDEAWSAVGDLAL